MLITNSYLLLAINIVENIFNKISTNIKNSFIIGYSLYLIKTSIQTKIDKIIININLSLSYLSFLKITINGAKINAIIIFDRGIRILSVGLSTIASLNFLTDIWNKK